MAESATGREHLAGYKEGLRLHNCLKVSLAHFFCPQVIPKMSTSITIVFIIMCSFLALVMAQTNVVSCRNHRSRLGSLARTIFIAGDRSMVIPRTLREVESNFCSSIGESITKIREISNSCLKPFPKQVTGMLIFGARKQHKRICKSVDEKKKIIKYVSCMDGQRQLDLLHDSMEQFIDFIESVRDDVKDNNMKIPYCCCYYQEFKKRMTAAFAPFCQRAAIEYTVDIVDGMMKDIMDLGCNNWDNRSDNCRNLLSSKPLNPPMHKATRARSFLVPLIDIFTSL